MARTLGRPALKLAAAVEYLAEHGETRAKDLAEHVGGTSSALISTLRVAVERGDVIKRVEPPRNAFYSLSPDYEPPEPEADLPPFNAALWADGELVLVGVTVNEDGTSVTLTAAQTRMLCQLLHGQGPES